MSITFRTYQSPQDYQRISAFLIENHQPSNRDGNWLEPAWEYMHAHPNFVPDDMDRFGIWANKGKIVAIVHYEDRLGKAFFQIKPGYSHLRSEMLTYAEEQLASPPNDQGTRQLCAYINDFDEPFVELAKSRGYQHTPEDDRPMAIVNIPEPFPNTQLPPGFHLTSLAEQPDWVKVNRVMWRGFNHPGEPDGRPEELESRRQMFDTITARRALKIAVVAPNGDFVAFCGMFYQPQNRFAYVEPVATDPEYRRMGLGKAAVLEGIRRCAELGATRAFVGSNQTFYLALGFRVIYVSQCWCKNWRPE